MAFSAQEKVDVMQSLFNEIPFICIFSKINQYKIKAYIVWFSSFHLKPDMIRVTTQSVQNNLRRKCLSSIETIDRSRWEIIIFIITILRKKGRVINKSPIDGLLT